MIHHLPIDAWSCHIIWYIIYYRCMVMSYDTSPTIDACSFHMLHHLPSMHGHIIWYIIYHRCMIMWYDTCPTVMLYHIIHYQPVILYSPIYMSYYTRTTIDAWSYYKMHHLRSCHMIHHLSSMHGHVIWYITYHLCADISYCTSPTIDTWTYHIMHHLPSIHGHVIWYITYFWCMVMSCYTSITINAWSCHVIHHQPIYAWSCHMLHHLPSMHGHVI